MSQNFPNKLVAVVNKQIDSGVLMNALAHMCLGFGAHMGPSDLHLMDYKNAEGAIYPNISKIPFIILRRKIPISLLTCSCKPKKAAGVHYSVFTDTMSHQRHMAGSGGTYAGGKRGRDHVLWPRVCLAQMPSFLS